MSESPPSEPQTPTNDQDLLTILVATDNHLGFKEKDQLRGTNFVPQAQI